MNLYDLTEEMEKIGYEPDDARARVCQDIVLKDDEFVTTLLSQIVTRCHRPAISI